MKIEYSKFYIYETEIKSNFFHKYFPPETGNYPNIIMDTKMIRLHKELEGLVTFLKNNFTTDKIEISINKVEEEGE